MKTMKIKLTGKTKAWHDGVEERLNGLVRGYDRVARPLGLGVRRSRYDDIAYAFEGGMGEEIRKKHYDKSLRLLWKAQELLPWTTFHDSDRHETMLQEMAESALTGKEKAARRKINSADFKAMLDREYTQAQKQAIVNILALIGHGEAYAWLVSTAVMGDVRGTGARAALTMQVLEEAKHFVVLRELLQAFDCEIPRMPVWEYILLERILKMEGLEKFFGMNVVVEGFALSLFGLMASMPGLGFLRMFHLDESRHTALPSNYFADHPMNFWQRNNPRARWQRFALLLPAIPLLQFMEPDFAEIGVDVLEFGGSMTRKILHLADRVGFKLLLSTAAIEEIINWQFNLHARFSRPKHTPRNYFEAEATRGKTELEIEREIFRLDEAPMAVTA